MKQKKKISGWKAFLWPWLSVIIWPGIYIVSVYLKIDMLNSKIPEVVGATYIALVLYLIYVSIRQKSIKNIFIASLAFAMTIPVLYIECVPMLFISFAESHINANVPDDDVFSKYMVRDLSIYFSKKFHKEVSAEYQLLRDYPSQSGVAFPKYYAAVTITEKKQNKLIEKGFVRVAAKEQEEFEVYDYVSTAEIKKDPEKLKEIFPGDVVDKIMFAVFGENYRQQLGIKGSQDKGSDPDDAASIKEGMELYEKNHNLLEP